METQCGPCGCHCHRFNGILVALIGLDFLLGALGVLDAKVTGIVWPVLLMLIGIKKSLRCKCCSWG